MQDEGFPCFGKHMVKVKLEWFLTQGLEKMKYSYFAYFKITW